MSQKTMITCFIAGLLVGTIMAFTGAGKATNQDMIQRTYTLSEAMPEIRPAKSYLHPVSCCIQAAKQ